jgi:hypothetical protein
MEEMFTSAIQNFEHIHADVRELWRGLPTDLESAVCEKLRGLSEQDTAGKLITLLAGWAACSLAREGDDNEQAEILQSHC